jgi:Domain of unknown function (DUF4116)
MDIRLLSNFISGSSLFFNKTEDEFSLINKRSWHRLDVSEIKSPQDLKTNALKDKFILEIEDLYRGGIDEKTAEIGLSLYGRLVTLQDEKLFDVACKVKDAVDTFLSSQELNQSTSNFLKSNKDFVIKQLKTRGSRLQYLSPEQKKDRVLVEAALSSMGTAIQYADDELKKDKALALLAVNNDAGAFQFLDPILRNDEEICFRAVKKNGLRLEYASEHLKSSPLIVLEATKTNPKSLNFASDEIKNNVIVMRDILSLQGLAIEYASIDIKNHNELAKVAINSNYRAYNFLSPELKIDREIVALYLKKSKTNAEEAFSIIEEPLRSDIEFLKECIKSNIHLLKIAPAALKQDEEFILELAQLDPDVINYCDKAFLSNKRFAIEIVSREPTHLGKLDKLFLEDIDVMTAACQVKGTSIMLASDELQADFDLAMKAISQSGEALRYLSNDLKNNEEIVLKALETSPMAIGYASEEIKDNEDIVRAAISKNPESFRFASLRLRSDRAFAVEALAFGHQAIAACSSDLKKDKELIEIAVMKDYTAFNSADITLKGDKTYVLRLAARKPSILKFATAELKKDFDLFKNLVGEHPSVIRNADKSISHDKACLLELYKLNPRVVELASPPFSADHAFLKDLFYLNAQAAELYLARLEKHDQINLKNAVYAVIDAKIERLAFSQEQFPYLLPHMRERHVGELKTKVKDLFKKIKEYRNEPLRNHMLKVFFESSQDEASFINDLIAWDKLLETKKLADKSFLPTFLLSSLSKAPHNLPEALILSGCDFLKTKRDDLKQPPQLQAVLKVLEKLSKPSLSLVAKTKIIEQCLNRTPEFPETLKRLRAVDCLADMEPQKLDTIASLGSEDLNQVLLSSLIEGGFIDEEEIPDCHAKFSEKFLTSRMPTGIFLYAKQFTDEPEMKKAIKEFIAHVLNDTLTTSRHEKNSSKDYLSPAQIVAWETALPTIEIDAESHLSAVESEDWQDLFLVGTEVTGSCQLITGNPNLNRALLGYALDGKSKVLAIKSASGKIEARAIIKLLRLDGGEPCIFIEDLYPDNKYQEAIFRMAKEKASSMGIKLYEFTERDIATRVHLTVSAAPFEYEDGARRIFETGDHSFSASEVPLD